MCANTICMLKQKLFPKPKPSLWGLRLAGAWLVLTVATDFTLSQLAGRDDLFFSIVAMAPGIPLAMAVWTLLIVVFGHIEATASFYFLYHFSAIVTLYALGAFAEHVYYK